MSDIAIKVENLTKVYKLYDKPIDRLKESLHPFKKSYHRDFYALNNVSFEVKKGETVGIIGKNGSGKSTLLKIITGVLTPTSGNVYVNGKISALLELGAGFNPEFTGIENVYFQGMLMGYTKEEMDAKLEEILSFADIGDFVYQPVKTYSSGMFVRLAFAVAINVDPDILIVDEALAVGDIRFQQKCYRKMYDFKEKSKTILFVTHDIGAVNNFCTRALMMDNGVIKLDDIPQTVTKKYLAYMSFGLETVEGNSIITNNSDSSYYLKFEDVTEWESTSKYSSFGFGGAKITDVVMYYQNSKEKVSILKGGEPVSFFMKLEVYEDILSPGIGLVIRDRLGNSLLEISSYVDEYKIPPLISGQTLVARIDFTFPKIANGVYTISPAIAEGNQLNHIQHHWVNDAYIVEVSNNDLRYHMGVVVAEKAFYFIEYK